MGTIGSTQSKVLNLLKQGYKQVDIAKTLKISKPRVSLIVKQLKKKQLFFKEQIRGGVLTKVNALQPSSNIWRYHALQLEVRPYYFTNKYYQLLKDRGGYTTKVDQWRYILYYKKIIVWLEAGEDFVSVQPSQSLAKAGVSFTNALKKIAHDCGFRFDKDRRHSVKLLKHHLAYTNCPEWQVITEQKVYVQFKLDDGVVFLQYDRSKGLGEREYIHSRQAVDHADIIEPYIKDFLNHPLTNSQLGSRLSDTITAIDKLRQVVEKYINGDL